MASKTRAFINKLRAEEATAGLIPDGDSTCVSVSEGHMSSTIKAINDWFPCKGVLMGVGAAVSAFNDQGFDRAMMLSASPAGVVTSGYPAGCNGGLVAPSGYHAPLGLYLAANANTFYSATNALLMRSDCPVNLTGPLVYSVHWMEINDANATVRNNSSIQASVYYITEYRNNVGIFGSRIALGTVTHTATTGTTGTLKRTDLEIPPLNWNATNGNGIGGVFASEAPSGAVGPAAVLMQSFVAKAVPFGFIATQGWSLGGNPLNYQLRQILSTANCDKSRETQIKILSGLAASSYAGSTGGAADGGTPGGFGGNDIYYTLCIDFWGHNESGNGGNSFVTKDDPTTWEFTAGVASINTGGGTVTTDSAATLAALGTGGTRFCLYVDGAGNAEFISFTGTSGANLTGCTFAAYGSTATSRTGGNVYFGYQVNSANGFRADLIFKYNWNLQRHLNAGLAADKFRYCLWMPFPVSDAPQNLGSASRTAGREYIFSTYRTVARALEDTLPYFLFVDPAQALTFQRLLERRALACNSANGIASTGTTVSVDSGSTVNVVSATYIPAPCDTLLIGNEWVSVLSKLGNVLTIDQRGLYGTTQQTWASGTPVAFADPIHHSRTGYEFGDKATMAFEMTGATVGSDGTIVVPGASKSLSMGIG